MVSQGLDDEEISDVVNYILNSWETPPVNKLLKKLSHQLRNNLMSFKKLKLKNPYSLAYIIVGVFSNLDDFFRYPFFIGSS